MLIVIVLINCFHKQSLCCQCGHSSLSATPCSSLVSGAGTSKGVWAPIAHHFRGVLGRSQELGVQGPLEIQVRESNNVKLCFIDLLWGTRARFDLQPGDAGVF